MSFATWVSLSTTAAAIANVGSLIAVVWQLRSLGRQTAEAARQNHLNAEAIRTSARISVMQEMIAIDRFFCEHPDLRAAIYGVSAEPDADERSQRTEAAAEMLMDFAECLYYQHRHFDGEPIEAWVTYFQDVFKRSEAMQRFMRANGQWYEAGLRELFEPDLASPGAAPS